MHKVQGLKLDQGAADLNVKKQKPFGPDQLYTALLE